MAMTSVQPITDHPTQSLDTLCKEDLALAHQLFAMLKMDDLTYEHLSVRSQEDLNTYFINPLGLLFEEVTKDTLLRVDLEGNQISKSPYTFNKTGQNIHGILYKTRPDVQSIMHLHTPACVAVSSLEAGFLPLSQFSYHFEGCLAYHEYGGLVLEEEEQAKLLQSLGNNKVLMLRNHGALTVGRTIQEAFFLMYYLDLACKVQLQILGTGAKTILPAQKIRQHAHTQMRDFEPDLGRRDWDALVRRLKRFKRAQGDRHANFV